MHNFQYDISSVNDYFAETKKWLREDNRNFVENNGALFKSAYTSYLEHATPCTLENVTPVWPYIHGESKAEHDCKEKLRSQAKDLYEAKRHSMDKYWDEIINKNGGADIVCPICGIAPCQHLDHYIPREQMPEFSVFPPNLIPLCYDCNHDKKAIWLNLVNERVIFNAFYDTLPDKPICECNISIVNEMPYATIVKGSRLCVADKEDRRVLATIDQLGLLDRWQIACNKTLRVETNKLQRGYKADTWPNPADYWQYKCETYTDVIADLPTACFIEKVLYQGIVNSQEMKDWLCNSLKSA